MGYTTEFEGSFTLDKPLTPAQRKYLVDFQETRRMKRNAHLTENFEDKVREAVGLPVGVEGGFYVGGAEDGDFGQSKDSSILDYNKPPKGQPGLWCQWIPNDDGTAIEWNQGEKFYDYVEWLEYLIKNFLAPWGYKLNGEVSWQGEEGPDMGKIVVKNNKVTTKRARITYE